MGDTTTGQRVEASLKVYLTWDVEDQRWIVDSINNDGYPLDYAVVPELVNEDGNATEADLAAASEHDIFASDLHALLAEALAH